MRRNFCDESEIALQSRKTSNESPFLSGVPGEVAYHGLLFPLTWMVSGTLALLFVGGLFISVFYKMRLTSVYEVSLPPSFPACSE